MYRYSTGQCVSWQRNTMLWCFWTNAMLPVSWARQEGMIYAVQAWCHQQRKTATAWCH